MPSKKERIGKFVNSTLPNGLNKAGQKALKAQATVVKYQEKTGKALNKFSDKVEEYQGKACIEMSKMQDELNAGLEMPELDFGNSSKKSKNNNDDLLSFDL